MNHAHRSRSTRPRARTAVGLAVALALATIVVGIGPTASASPIPAAPEPLVTFGISAPSNGAHLLQGQFLAADYTCTPTTGQGSVDYCTGPVPNGAAVDTKTVGPHDFEVQARYNRIIYTGVVTYYVDPRPGSIVITSPSEGITYDRTKPPLATFSCTPGSFPVKSCVGTDEWNPLGTTYKNIYTSGQRVKAQVGAHKFTVVATDTQGNVTSVTRNYKIGVGHVPDAIIAGKGDNIYDVIAKQTLPVSRKAALQTVKLTVQNDGVFPERLRVKGAGTQMVRIKLPGVPAFTSPGWQVGYYERGTCSTCLGRNITKWVVAGTYLTPALSHNGTQTILMAVIPTPFAVAVNRDVTITSPADPKGLDVVRAALR